MFADVDHSHPAVRNDIFQWGSWITSSLNLSGMRLDAIKHYSLSFLKDFISHIDKHHKDQFFVGEYWDAKTEVLEKVIQKFQGRLNLFDVQLVYTFSDYSKGRSNDMRAILDGSLVQRDPAHAVVSFVPKSYICTIDGLLTSRASQDLRCQPRYARDTVTRSTR